MKLKSHRNVRGQTHMAANKSGLWAQDVVERNPVHYEALSMGGEKMRAGSNRQPTADGRFLATAWGATQEKERQALSPKSVVSWPQRREGAPALSAFRS
eukprot:CAMPEP_0174372522 /NCGR_PEP_ID=MMETSP0811_2-20130205/103959_1 /TAXON_ID=73025 ORGANISM="Eutreptiella gymnastica-like, Strain CCMP1594" /NCGR_SAMPLE_ID=MMETSP0811_2 /ASSEMBLY_ACC=CAM_ASM_000667 /LENGTH=98 /DNA_ID=CAMNT_0015520035 /DNA_START=1 /DNA_END=295 /DNA_ORIENTATION=+